MRAVRRRPVAGRSDPAPSRWAYRAQRLMLTPGFRGFLRLGVPLLLVAALAGAWLAADDRRAQLIALVDDLRGQIESRPEFMVSLLAIEGASPEIDAAIRDNVPVALPASSFDLDLDAILAGVRDLAAVKEARVRVRSGGVLEIVVTERAPVILWRTADAVLLLDAEGVAIGEIDSRLDRRDLPLVAGLGADLHVPEALAILRAAEPLGDRLRGLVRVGERRWDLVLDRDQRILLPETRPDQALERVIALHQAQDILERDLVTLDMRLAARPTLRMGSAASEARWKTGATAMGD